MLVCSRLNFSKIIKTIFAIMFLYVTIPNFSFDFWNNIKLIIVIIIGLILIFKVLFIWEIYDKRNKY